MYLVTVEILVIHKLERYGLTLLKFWLWHIVKRLRVFMAQFCFPYLTPFNGHASKLAIDFLCFYISFTTPNTSYAS